jgi:hypothetical protein
MSLHFMNHVEKMYEGTTPQPASQTRRSRIQIPVGTKVFEVRLRRWIFKGSFLRRGSNAGGHVVRFYGM